MKKLFLFLTVLSVFTSSVFAFDKNDEDFTWHDYEVLCWFYDKEPSWEQYEYLCKNPQCIDINEFEMFNLFNEIKLNEYLE